MTERVKIPCDRCSHRLVCKMVDDAALLQNKLVSDLSSSNSPFSITLICEHMSAAGNVLRGLREESPAVDDGVSISLEAKKISEEAMELLERALNVEMRLGFESDITNLS